MRTTLILTTVLAALALAVVETQAAERQGDPARGARLYASNCNRCHNLRSANELGDREWSIVVAHMRAVAGLPGDQARDIEAFLQRANNPPRPTLPDVAAGTALSGPDLIERYACRGCHVIGGTGGAAGPSLDSVFDRRDVDWVRIQIRSPRQHNPATVMPDLALTNAEVEVLINTLRRSRRNLED